MVNRKPVNYTNVNVMGYVAVTCNGKTRQPKVFTEKPPLAPHSVGEAIRTKYAQRLLEYEQRRLAAINKIEYESVPCGYRFAITPGETGRCPRCHNVVNVERVQPKPLPNRLFKDAQLTHDAVKVLNAARSDRTP